MQAACPHFLLYSEAGESTGSPPRWRFVLQPIGGDKFLTAEDAEPGVSGNRLELLAVVRGLEALEQPSRVTLLTTSRYVNRGIRRCLGQWRERTWRWERFGQLVPIRNQDLWQRIDRAMQFHQLECWSASLAEGQPTSSQVESSAWGSSTRQWRFDPRESNPRPRSPFFRTLKRLRQGVLAPIAAIWRPAFTRAA